MPTAFITVGSTYFQPLTTAASSDSFLTAALKAGYTNVVIQYGKGAAPSTNVGGSRAISGDSKGKGKEDRSVLRCFAFTDEFEKEVKESDIVISHAGSASILTALRFQKPLIVVPNTTLADNHQVELADALGSEGYLKVSSVENLSQTIRSLPFFDPASFPTSVDPNPKELRPFPPFKPERFRKLIDEEMGF